MVVSIATIPSHCRLVLAKEISRVGQLIQNQLHDRGITEFILLKGIRLLQKERGRQTVAVRNSQFGVEPGSDDALHDRAMHIMQTKKESVSGIHDPTSRFIDRR